LEHWSDSEKASALAYLFAQMQTRRAEKETDGLRRAVYVLLEKLPRQQDCLEFVDRVMLTVRAADALPFEGHWVTSVRGFDGEGGYDRDGAIFRQIRLVVANFDNLEESLASWGMWHEGEELEFPGKTGKRRAEQQTHITMLPTVLMFQLMRFRWNEAVHRSQKIGKAFAFPEEVDMIDLCTNDALDGPTTYNLCAVVVHQGTPVAGHYWAYIKNIENWYKFDDEKFSGAIWKDVEVTGTGNDWVYGSAYLLFHKRAGSEDLLASAFLRRFWGMPLRFSRNGARVETPRSEGGADDRSAIFFRARLNWFEVAGFGAGTAAYWRLLASETASGGWCEGTVLFCEVR
jgi:hypothetical protein